MAPLTLRPVACAEAVSLLDTLDRLHARAPQVTAPERCAAAATLEAIPNLMRPAGRFRADRARLLHAYLRAVKADAQGLVKARAEGGWLGSRLLKARLNFWFAGLHACGWLYRASIPMNGAFVRGCRALTTIISNGHRA
jgi:hypothetical protein